MSSGSEALHPIERAILKALDSGQPGSVESLSKQTGLDLDQVRRGIEWLKFKNLVDVREDKAMLASLGKEGMRAASEGLPERRLVVAVRSGLKTLSEIVAGGRLGREETNAAVAAAKRNGWISFDQGGTISVESEVESPEEVVIKKLREGELDPAVFSGSEKLGFESLSKRPDYVVLKELKNVRVSITESGKSASAGAVASTRERALTPRLITSGEWRQVELAPIDVAAPAPTVHAGRIHPLVEIIREIKEIFVGLGFEEIDGPVVQSGFWNFDALYIPQDHSAREMQDTFYVSGKSQKISATDSQKKQVARIHEKGWGSRWNVSEAERAVLRTHTTPVTLRHLASTRSELGRFFSIGRVFRNEKPSYKHLVEFHQVEGVATAKGLSLRDLMGLQKEFYSKMGIKKVKFWPTFFPYTEPSLQSMVFNDSLQKWVELFGMGIFRPEVTGPLGIKHPVLAWGGGIERIAMLRYGLDDVRELYGSSLSWLRRVPRCQL